MTRMVEGGLPTDQMLAYHERRAEGGAGLIIMEAARVHDSALSDSPAIDASTDACIPAYRNIAKAVQRHGARLFGQVSHSGRANDRRRGGLKAVPYSASAVPDERFHNMPRAMSTSMVEEVIQSYGKAAARLAEAGLDGIEIPASHCLLPAQFLNPNINQRNDKYGGDFLERLQFLTEIIQCVRTEIGRDLILGIRISIDEMEHNGLLPSLTTEICHHLGVLNALDYYNVIAGSMSGHGGSVHVVPPMMIQQGYTTSLAKQLRHDTIKPIFLAGRINQPQMAEQILAQGHADFCGMTRALISDPDMPNKVIQNRIDDIRACIGCNQACIGHYHLGTPISCIQNPTTGRERSLSNLSAATQPKKVVVAGAGPAGLKAAITAAERGHLVTLCEVESRIGGQVKLAERLPERSEFGGLITNLEHEAKQKGVNFSLNTWVNLGVLKEYEADAVIIATGAKPYRPYIPGEEEGHVVDAWQLLTGKEKPGAHVLVYDWRSDWVGLGLAQHLALQGSKVTLAVNGIYAGEEVQSYTRDHWIGALHKLGVDIITYARLHGVDDDSVYLEHIISYEPIIIPQIDTLALALGHQSITDLEAELLDGQIEYYLAGDCLSPRSAEEAVYEGMMAGMQV